MLLSSKTKTLCRNLSLPVQAARFFFGRSSSSLSSWWRWFFWRSVRFVGENNPEGKDMISNAPGPKSEKSIPENLSKEVEKNMQSTSGFVREMITKDDADGVWVKLVSAPESNAEKASSSVESLFYVQESTEGFDELRSGVFVTILHFENASSKEYVYGDAVIPSGEKKETVSQ
ncbi:MAG: hypothetical protein IPL87_04480 [Candidatus Moraniibacteriota bacterium]|nr:MAG: hypothetical protein IPL87_04480 [Candidatus Moranbacteria bacterium]